MSEDPAPLTLQPQEELKDLESYIQGWWEEDVVEETEVETIDKVKQVLLIISMVHYITPELYFCLKMKSKRYGS